MPTRTRRKVLHLAASSLIASCSIVGLGLGAAGAQDGGGDEGGNPTPAPPPAPAPAPSVPPIPPDDPGDMPSPPIPGGGG